MAGPEKYDIPDATRLGGNPSAAAGDGATDAGGAHDQLMAISGVVMVGEGLDEAGHPVLIVGVRTEQDLARVPASFGGIAVRAQVIGEVVAQSLNPPPA
jgi:hypothetical protein